MFGIELLSQGFGCVGFGDWGLGAVLLGKNCGAASGTEGIGVRWEAKNKLQSRIRSDPTPA